MLPMSWEYAHNISILVFRMYDPILFRNIPKQSITEHKGNLLPDRENHSF